MTHYKTYPFTKIVGQDLMKQALILNAINPRIGGVLIKGAKGTAKSTAVRALADLLPEIPSIADCPFNCNPYNDKEACHACQHRIHQNLITDEDIIMRHMRVINLPINATEDRIVGTLNIETALTQGLKALEPGILAESHRNILYIDEVNLLADNVADILLDAAAMGVNIIEREGISLHHPAKFILIGTMNPEEGHLRPQLLDRFGLSVEVEKIRNIDQRVEIIKNLEAYHADPTKFHDDAEPEQEKLRQQIIQARKILSNVSITHELLRKIAQIGVDFETDGHRADITMDITAKTIAAFHGRTEVQLEDIRLAASLALPHRMRKLPFEDDHLDEDKLDNSLSQESPSPSPPEDSPMESNTEDHNAESIEQPSLSSQPPNNPQTSLNNNAANLPPIGNTPEMTFAIDDSVNTDPLLSKKRIRTEMNATGNMVSHPTRSSRGKYVGTKKRSKVNIPTHTDIAIVPTLNSASLNPENRQRSAENPSLTVKEENIFIKSRYGKSSYLIIFCLDTSGSMGARNRMEVAKGAIFSILQKNYVHRDKVCMITFRDRTAQVVLPPTRSTDLAYRMLQEIPTGGATPLAAGLLESLKIAEEEHRKATGYIPLIILISDARGNVAFNSGQKDVLNLSREIAKQEINMIVIDTEQSQVSLGYSPQIAETANATYYHIDHLTVERMEQIFTQEGIIHAES